MTHMCKTEPKFPMAGFDILRVSYSKSFQVPLSDNLIFVTAITRLLFYPDTSFKLLHDSALQKEFNTCQRSFSFSSMPS